jgi:cold shock protein
MSSASSSDTSAPVRLTGRVKWFNNKTGFGFISVVGGNDQFKDASEVFVHHSAVTVSQEQYRYLVEGEYVEFSVVSTDSGDHKFQAGDVRGVKGGKLFCETRHEHRVSQDGSAGANVERGRPQVRGRSQGYTGGRGGSSGSHGGGNVGRGGRVDRGGRSGGSGGEWMLVRRDRNEHSDSRGHGHGHGHGRGRSEDYSDRPSRSDKYQSRAYAPTQAPAPVPAPATAPAADKKEVNDVPETPRAAPTKRGPRQSKPTA